MFGNFSVWEILLVLVLVLLLFGAKRIPEIAGSMGKGIKEFKRSLTDVERSLGESDSRDRLREPAADVPVRRDAVAEEERPAPKRLMS